MSGGPCDHTEHYTAAEFAGDPETVTESVSERDSQSLTQNTTLTVPYHNQQDFLLVLSIKVIEHINISILEPDHNYTHSDKSQFSTSQSWGMMSKTSSTSEIKIRLTRIRVCKLSRFP